MRTELNIIDSIVAMVFDRTPRLGTLTEGAHYQVSSVFDYLALIATLR